MRDVKSSWGEITVTLTESIPHKSTARALPACRVSHAPEALAFLETGYWLSEQRMSVFGTFDFAESIMCMEWQEKKPPSCPAQLVY